MGIAVIFDGDGEFLARRVEIHQPAIFDLLGARHFHRAAAGVAEFGQTLVGDGLRLARRSWARSKPPSKGTDRMMMDAPERSASFPLAQLGQLAAHRFHLFLEVRDFIGLGGGFGRRLGAFAGLGLRRRRA